MPVQRCHSQFCVSLNARVWLGPFKNAATAEIAKARSGRRRRLFRSKLPARGTIGFRLPMCQATEVLLNQPRCVHQRREGLKITRAGVQA